MKTRKLITVVSLCLVGLTFCFPWTVLAAGGSPYPGSDDPACQEIPYNMPCTFEKIVGPVTKAILIAGWVDGTSPVDAFLFVNGVLYVAELFPVQSASDFEAVNEEIILKWPLPKVIAGQFGVDLGSTGRVVIAEAKDVTNFLNAPREDAFQGSGFSTYAQIISCDVKISFIITEKKYIAPQ